MESRIQGSKPRTQKNIRGPGPTFPGKTLSRPRTGKPVAKIKDQGYNAEVFSKNKRSSRKTIKHFCEIQAFSKNKNKKVNYPRGLWRASRRRKKNSHNHGPFSTNQKPVLSSAEDKAFARTLGFEAKAKHLTFEPKAKFFKTYPCRLQL